MLLAAAIAWAALMLAHSVPYWPIDPSLSSSPWFNFQLDLLRCGVGYFSGDLPVGSQFSTGPGIGRLASRGPGTIGGRPICG